MQTLWKTKVYSPLFPGADTHPREYYFSNYLAMRQSVINTFGDKVVEVPMASDKHKLWCWENERNRAAVFAQQVQFEAHENPIKLGYNMPSELQLARELA